MLRAVTCCTKPEPDMADQSDSKRPWVLISEGGSGASRAAVAAVRALAAAGYQTTVTESGDRSLAGASHDCARRVTVPRVDADAAKYAAAVRAELATRPYVTTFFTTD